MKSQLKKLRRRFRDRDVGEGTGSSSAVSESLIADVRCLKYEVRRLKGRQTAVLDMSVIGSLQESVAQLENRVGIVQGDFDKMSGRMRGLKRTTQRLKTGDGSGKEGPSEMHQLMVYVPRTYPVQLVLQTEPKHGR
jgi:hypothetical protein